MIDIENYLYYSDEFKKALTNTAYYLAYLKNEQIDNESLTRIDAIGNQLNVISQTIQNEEDRIKDKSERSKTEEDIKREAHLKQIKKIYFEHTGNPLLLSDKDIMENIKNEMNRVSQELNTYQAPQPEWGDFFSSKNKDWAAQMVKKLESINKE